MEPGGGKALGLLLSANVCAIFPCGFVPVGFKRLNYFNPLEIGVYMGRASSADVTHLSSIWGNHGVSVGLFL